MYQGHFVQITYLELAQIQYVQKYIIHEQYTDFRAKLLWVSFLCVLTFKPIFICSFLCLSSFAVNYFPTLQTGGQNSLCTKHWHCHYLVIYI